MAAAHLRLEQAFFAHPLPPDEVARINKAFDQATKAFFLGNNAEAIRVIDALTELLATAKLSPQERAIVSLKVVVEPAVWTSGRPVQAACRVASMYEWRSEEPVELRLQLCPVDVRRHTMLERRIAVTVGSGCAVEACVSLEVASDRLTPGL